jgi:predicted phage terminase large subunit-like protein
MATTKEIEKLGKDRVHTRWHATKKHLMTPDDLVGPDQVEPEKRKRELQFRMQALQELQLRKARRSFPAFMEYCFVDPGTGKAFGQQWFHDEWSDAMDTENRLIICAPRDHGKTSQIIGRVIYELGRDPNLRIKIACASDGRAKERLFEVSQNILYNARVKEVFPHMEPDPDAQWNVHKVHVRRDAKHRDASIEALGITSTATGGRCDLLIADDVVDRRNALSFPALREQIKMAWLADWTNLLEPDSKVWAICTLWHKDDLNHMLMDNPAYTTLFYAIPPDFGSMWTDKWPEHELRMRHREIGTVEFNRGFRNQAVDTESQMVQESWLHYKDLNTDPEFNERLPFMEFFTSYDTAGSPTGSASQDYSSACIIAVDIERKKIYVVDAWHQRLTIKKMASIVKKEAAKYFPFRILIEKIGQSSLDEWVLNDYPELTGTVEVTKPRVNKAIRLLAVTPLLEMGNVIFDKHLDPNNSQWEPGRGSLILELMDFPFSKHDDMVDAFSQALDGARRYFLDAWASKGENEVDISVGLAEADDSPYLF